jgi:hypothetical protein
MKRFIKCTLSLIIFLALAFWAVLLFGPSSVFAAGTVTVTSENCWSGMCTMVVTATADATDGSFPATTLRPIHGLFYYCVNDPGATAPTDDWDYTLTDAAGRDLLGTGGTDEDEAVTGINYANDGTNNIFTGLPINEAPVLTITGNSVNSAVIVFTIVSRRVLPER